MSFFIKNVYKYSKDIKLTKVNKSNSYRFFQYILALKWHKLEFDKNKILQNLTDSNMLFSEFKWASNFINYNTFFIEKYNEIIGFISFDKRLDNDGNYFLKVDRFGCNLKSSNCNLNLFYKIWKFLIIDNVCKYNLEIKYILSAVRKEYYNFHYYIFLKLGFEKCFSYNSFFIDEFGERDLFIKNIALSNNDLNKKEEKIISLDCFLDEYNKNVYELSDELLKFISSNKNLLKKINYILKQIGCCFSTDTTIKKESKKITNLTINFIRDNFLIERKICEENFTIKKYLQLVLQLFNFKHFNFINFDNKVENCFLKNLNIIDDISLNNKFNISDISKFTKKLLKVNEELNLFLSQSNKYQKIKEWSKIMEFYIKINGKKSNTNLKDSKINKQNLINFFFYDDTLFKIKDKSSLSRYSLCEFLLENSIMKNIKNSKFSNVVDVFLPAKLNVVYNAKSLNFIKSYRNEIVHFSDEANTLVDILRFENQVFYKKIKSKNITFRGVSLTILWGIFSLLLTSYLKDIILSFVYIGNSVENIISYTIFSIIIFLAIINIFITYFSYKSKVLIEILDLLNIRKKILRKKFINDKMIVEAKNNLLIIDNIDDNNLELFVKFLESKFFYKAKPYKILLIINSKNVEITRTIIERKINSLSYSSGVVNINQRDYYVYDDEIVFFMKKIISYLIFNKDFTLNKSYSLLFEFLKVNNSYEMQEFLNKNTKNFINLIVDIYSFLKVDTQKTSEFTNNFYNCINSMMTDFYKKNKDFNFWTQTLDVDIEYIAIKAFIKTIDYDLYLNYYEHKLKFNEFDTNLKEKIESKYKKLFKNLNKNLKQKNHINIDFNKRSNEEKVIKIAYKNDKDIR